VVLTLIGYSLLFFIFLASVLLISAGPVLGWWLGGAVGALLGGVATVLGALSIRWWGRGTRPPPGIEVSRRELPELFERIDVLQKQLGSSMIHRVYVDEGTSASVLQLPRARVFGVNENHLVIGLPLMAALSPTDLDGVLAHELAHLRQGWSVGEWVWRARRIFRRVVQVTDPVSIRSRRPPSLLWAEQFELWSGSMARDYELLADARAAASVGPRVLADALCHQALVAARVSEWTPPRGMDLPPADRVESLMRIAAHVQPHRDRRRLDVMLLNSGYRLETHPHLSERLDALQVAPKAVEPPTVSAADHYLRWRASELAAKLSRNWIHRVRSEWGTQVQLYRNEVASLQQEWALAGSAFLPERRVSDLVERALTLGVFDQLPVVDMSHLSGPEAAFASRDYEAAAQSSSLVVRSAALVRLADMPDANPRWVAELARLEAEHALAADERRHLDTIAFLVRPTLDAETRLAIVHRLRRESGVRRAWLVRRRVRYLPEHPEHVLFLELEPMLAIAPSRHEWPQQVGGARVVILRGAMRRLRPRLRRIPNAELDVGG
jgi:Zn-dependent protease with chaperone function